jgi:hypothetical protein
MIVADTPKSAVVGVAIHAVSTSAAIALLKLAEWLLVSWLKRWFAAIRRSSR